MPLYTVNDWNISPHYSNIIVYYLKYYNQINIKSTFSITVTDACIQ